MFGRLLTSLVAAVGVTLIVIVVLVLEDRRELTMRVGGVGDTSRRIAELTNALIALDSEARAESLARLTSEPTFISGQGQPEERPPPRERDLDAIERSFTDELHSQLGSAYPISITPARPETTSVIRLLTGPGPRDQMPGPPPRFERPDDIGPPNEMRPPPEPPDREGSRGPPGPRGGPDRGLMDITVSLPSGADLVFRVSPPRRDPPLPVQLFIQLGILTLVLALVLYLVTRNITRPLSELAQAADGIGRTARHAKLPEKGVREIRDATRAFNTMQDRLLRYLDSRTRVLAAMSHDLRTPLTRLRLRIEALEDPAQREPFEADLDEMENLVGSALGLFKGFDDTEAFELTDVEALLATLRAEFTEMGANVSVEGRARQPIFAKPRAFKRCFSNLIANAIKFGTMATVLIEDGDALVIRIRDDGPGIPEASLEQVFEPFFRLESSRNRDTGGTGLGLTIARDIVQSHGGTLVLRNLPGAGLEAIVTIPRDGDHSTGSP